MMIGMNGEAGKFGLSALLDDDDDVVKERIGWNISVRIYALSNAVRNHVWLNNNEWIYVSSISAIRKRICAVKIHASLNNIIKMRMKWNRTIRIHVSLNNAFRTRMWLSRSDRLIGNRLNWFSPAQSKIWRGGYGTMKKTFV